jgi:hypothetical protein
VESAATFAVGGAGGELVLINDKRVVITVSSEQAEAQLTLGPAGMIIKLKYQRSGK